MWLRPAFYAHRRPLYPNALANVGLNFVKCGSFPWVFPKLSETSCLATIFDLLNCADLMSLYKKRVAKDYLDRVAGSFALIIPSANVDDIDTYGRYLNDVRQMMEQASRA